MTLLLVEISVILLVTAACGWLAKRIGQARVIGEIIGGILIGPSVLGRLAPDLSSHLFSKSTSAAFDSLSTLGLVLFLFLVGIELDFDELLKHRKTALLASALSITIPFATGALLAHSLRIRFAPQGIGSLPFVLFLGIAMSITAFPVLARILEERGLQGTPVGTMAIFCAAVDDVSAWSLLAFTLALMGKGDHAASVSTRMLTLVVYLAAMVFVIRPLGNWASKRHKDGSALSLELLSVIIAGVLLSAAATDFIGVHPLFGAFLAGVCFPRIPRWQAAIRTQMDMIVSVLLLPLFFALTGLRTRLDLLSNPNMWLWAGIVFVAAVVGKMSGAAMAARWAGQSWKDALTLGALLNTRGLVELIVLNIAYNTGVFSPTLFTMLVLMALGTTMTTVPILNLLGVRSNRNTRKPNLAEPEHNEPIRLIKRGA